MKERGFHHQFHLPSPLRAQITSTTTTPITTAPTIIVVHAINGERIEVPTSLPIEATSPSPTISIAPISIIETVTVTSTEPAHTAPGPQIVSTIPIVTTVDAPLTVTILTIDPLTQQVIQKDVAGTSNQAEEAKHEMQYFKEPSNMQEAA